MRCTVGIHTLIQQRPHIGEIQVWLLGKSGDSISGDDAKSGYASYF
jgi:hypothetical protein